MLASGEQVFPRGDTNPLVTSTYYLVNCFQKLHENEEILLKRGRVPWVSWIHKCWLLFVSCWFCSNILVSATRRCRFKWSFFKKIVTEFNKNSAVTIFWGNYCHRGGSRTASRRGRQSVGGGLPNILVIFSNKTLWNERNSGPGGGGGRVRPSIHHCLY